MKQDHAGYIYLENDAGICSMSSDSMWICDTMNISTVTHWKHIYEMIKTVRIRVIGKKFAQKRWLFLTRRKLTTGEVVLKMSGFIS